MENGLPNPECLRLVDTHDFFFNVNLQVDHLVSYKKFEYKIRFYVRGILIEPNK